ncbi:hypothetical protein PV325_012464, partial [Microctonus aethiopoides]
MNDQIERYVGQKTATSVYIPYLASSAHYLRSMSSSLEHHQFTKVEEVGKWVDDYYFTKRPSFYEADLSCKNTHLSVGAIYTRTNFVTLKYITDGWGTESNGFRLVITAVKDPKNCSRLIPSWLPYWYLLPTQFILMQCPSSGALYEMTRAISITFSNILGVSPWIVAHSIDLQPSIGHFR